MSEQRRDETTVPSARLTIDELRSLQNATPVRDAQQLAAEVWESDEELDAFLADLRVSRGSSLT